MQELADDQVGHLNRVLGDGVPLRARTAQSCQLTDVLIRRASSLGCPHAMRASADEDPSMTGTASSCWRQTIPRRQATPPWMPSCTWTPPSTASAAWSSARVTPTLRSAALTSASCTWRSASSVWLVGRPTGLPGNALTWSALQALALLAQAHVSNASAGGGSALPALNCIARLRSDVPDDGQAGVLPFLALKANLLEGRCGWLGCLQAPMLRLQRRPRRAGCRMTEAHGELAQLVQDPASRLEMCAEALQLLLQREGQLQAVWEAMQQLLRQRIGSSDAFLTCLHMLMAASAPQVVSSWAALGLAVPARR